MERDFSLGEEGLCRTNRGLFHHVFLFVSDIDAWCCWFVDALALEVVAIRIGCRRLALSGLYVG